MWTVYTIRPPNTLPISKKTSKSLISKQFTLITFEWLGYIPYALTYFRKQSSTLSQIHVILREKGNRKIWVAAILILLR